MEYILMDGFIDEVIHRYTQMYATNRARHFVIELDGKLIACAGAFIKDDIPYSFYRERKYGFLGDVYVVPNHRRRGYARNLVQAALDWFRKQDIQSVRLLASHNARNLYISLGFQPTDEMIMHL